VGITESLIKALQAGLSIWDNKEKTKYIDKLLKLRKEYYEEYNKDRPDMARLDNINFELQLISEVFSSQVGIKTAPN